MRSTFRMAITLFILPLLFSCSSGDDPAVPSGGALDDVGLSAAAATTLDKVYLTGLPSGGKAGYEDYSVMVVAEGADPVPVYVEEDETGPFFRMTLHPTAPNEGGPVHVRVTDGDQSSPERDLQIAPLPEAPGAFQRLVETLRAVVEQRAQWAGTSFDELAALGFDPAMIMTMIGLNLTYQFWVHTQHIGKLGWYEWIFVTPSNHRVHHAQNEEYLDRNYGGVFIIWDRLFGTFSPEVDDEPVVAEVGKLQLEKMGYRVIASTSSVEALKLFEKDAGKYDLVMTDMTMPYMTGEKLAGNILAIRPDIPIILCTGYSEKFTRQNACEMGIRSFLMKPLVMKDLADTVRQALTAN